MYNVNFPCKDYTISYAGGHRTIVSKWKLILNDYEALCTLWSIWAPSVDPPPKEKTVSF